MQTEKVFEMLRTATALFLALSVSAVAQAQTVRTEVIEYSPSALSDEQAFDALSAEIRAAARRVCDIRTARGAAEARAARECIEDAVSNAFGQLNNEIAAYAPVTQILVR